MRALLRGRGVSPGVAVGRILRLESEPAPSRRESIPEDRVESETARFHAAREAARGELHHLRERVRQSLGETCASMLDAQRLILDDPGLVHATEDGISRERVSAPWALHVAVRDMLRRFEEIENVYFRERGGDLDDVHARLQRLMAEQPRREEAAQSSGGPTVVVARRLGPSDAGALARRGVIALASDLGGPTSHTAILAQALGIPAVVGVSGLAATTRTGDEIVVDGETGEVLVEPTAEDLRSASVRRDAWLEREAAMAAARDLPAVTRDGAHIVVRANIEFAEEVSAVLRFGARGVGLYRSEFLFLARAPELPSEEEHYRTYREIAERLAPHPAVIRTFDLGGEKYFHDVLETAEPNPVLGLRAVRLCLQRPEIFRPQIRGLLRAAAHGDVRVMIPLVTAPEEVREVRRILAEEARALREDGKPCRADLPLGIMVETPAAALTADLLAGEADFFSIGSNDLIQYALAVDRGNASVAYLYDPLHPAVLRMIRRVVEAGRGRGVPVALCGEMAADPTLAELLVGLGLREFSVQPRAVAGVRDAIRLVDVRRAEKLAEEALALPSGTDIVVRLRAGS